MSAGRCYAPLVRILMITRGFPPKGLWGSEGYSHDLARGFLSRGHEVDVFFPFAGEGGLEVEEIAPGLRTIEFRAKPRRGKPFVDSYHDARQDEALTTWLAQNEAYDRAHFTTLAGGVSIGLIGVVRPQVRELLVTITDLLPLCHRGQLLDAALQPCPGPEPKRCARCVMEPGPYARGRVGKKAKALLARGLGLFGTNVPIATPAAFRKRAAAFDELFAQVDHFLVAAAKVRDEYTARGLDPGRITALPYALDPSLYADIERPSPVDARLRIGVIAQLAPHKGVDVLVDAIESLPAELQKRMVVHLYGKPTSQHHPLYGERLVERIEASELPIELRGHFAPDQIGQVIADMDFMTLPSIWIESLPLVLLHTRAMGVPILGSDMGGVGPFIEDGVDGLVLRAGDVAAWANGLRRILEDEGLRQRLIEGGRARGVPMTMDEHLDVLESLDSIRAWASRSPD
jgi:glycosyltransferase involved in cell wall biosynthesis